MENLTTSQLHPPETQGIHFENDRYFTGTKKLKRDCVEYGPPQTWKYQGQRPSECDQHPFFGRLWGKERQPNWSIKGTMSKTEEKQFFFFKFHTKLRAQSLFLPHQEWKLILNLRQIRRVLCPEVHSAAWARVPSFGLCALKFCRTLFWNSSLDFVLLQINVTLAKLGKFSQTMQIKVKSVGAENEALFQTLTLWGHEWCKHKILVVIVLPGCFKQILFQQ